MEVQHICITVNRFRVLYYLIRMVRGYCTFLEFISFLIFYLKIKYVNRFS